MDLFEPEGVKEMLAEREAIAREDAGLSALAARAQAQADTEAWRHQCEVRYVLRMRAERGREAVDEYLALVAAKRGPAQAEKLRKDCAQQWQRGSRGAPGEGKA